MLIDVAEANNYQDVTSDQDNKANIKVMKYLYVDAVNELPSNSPKTRERPIYMNYFLESDHATDRVTRHPQTGIILNFNSEPIIFYY